MDADVSQCSGVGGVKVYHTVFYEGCVMWVILCGLQIRKNKYEYKRNLSASY